MNIWTVDITDSTGTRSIIGTAPDLAAARAAALDTVAAANARTGLQCPRYRVSVDGALAAILATGLDDNGLPDHRGIVELLDRIIG